jgi:CRISPR/Cas system CSM-associated protein Csm3 (group 7 of RAMP superfamily)
MDIKYRIEFLSEWHCGSGLAAGADTDALVIKDKDGFPYVPGKTIKGLFREAAEDLIELKYPDLRPQFIESFGSFSDKDDAKIGEIFFTNAELKSEEKMQIQEKGIAKFLYGRVYSTKINDAGTAEDGSLRSMETVIPCALFGEILNADDSLLHLLEDSAKMIKRMGVNRNRGLGRVVITLTK